ncbi:MAG: UDP-N-acetylmuramoyl-L-alanyl-D-glutamate--2,6-diaminopimelate ligase [Desulfobacteraceae bacterium 4484_190.2]|nr:MAG: UDP-N-acetylmuramoyl-L-alanyl-D-glutamate--2,6-diaminopimelate ligase [Desulfobacteraceae bacterium 4484_190.2]
MQLVKLLDGIAVKDFRGNSEIEIRGLAYDSRSVKPGYLFVALKGQAEDGHDFIKDALKNGAVALVLEQSRWTDTKAAIVQVSNSREVLSMLAVNFYNRPFNGMTLIGITGTNGKTTSSYVLESILSAAGVVPGVIGTINYRFSGQTLEAPVTTPESLDLMSILRKMADGGVTDVVMEVSSHALHLGRVRGCPFHVGVFTNISRDHLDYHNSMEAYFEAKSLLFRGLGEKGDHHLTWAVINADDPKAEELIRLTEANVVTYGLKKDRDVRAEGVQLTRNGMTARLVTTEGKINIHSSLIGDFNIYNILAASAAALCLGIDLKVVASGIARLKGVPGRLELVKNRQSLAIVVDYAHTPDALLKAISSVKSLTKGRLITVFGCGGDRDKGKRREMGRVAGEHSDLAFVTSDNPRTEDPAAIAAQIEEGVHESGLKKIEGTSDEDLTGPGYIIELDRGKAIRSAIELAHKSDLVLIAGKGHENYQVIGKEKRHFDDREVASEAVR